LHCCIVLPWIFLHWGICNDCSDSSSTCHKSQASTLSTLSKDLSIQVDLITYTQRLRLFGLKDSTSVVGSSVCSREAGASVAGTAMVGVGTGDCEVPSTLLRGVGTLVVAQSQRRVASCCATTSSLVIAVHEPSQVGLARSVSDEFLELGALQSEEAAIECPSILIQPLFQILESLLSILYTIGRSVIDTDADWTKIEHTQSRLSWTIRIAIACVRSTGWSVGSLLRASISITVCVLVSNSCAISRRDWVCGPVLQHRLFAGGIRLEAKQPPTLFFPTWDINLVLIHIFFAGQRSFSTRASVKAST
ncbi:hypothetical protein KCU81_g482, partial [Aureobasidium melanogenum]